MRYAGGPQPLMLARARSADDLSALPAADLYGRLPHPAGRGVHQDPLSRLHVAQPHEHEPGGQIVDRQGGGPNEIDAIGQRRSLQLRHADHVGVAAEVRHGGDPLTHRESSDPDTHRIDGAGDFVPHHRRQLRRVGIQPHAGHDVGEVDARRRHPHPHLTRPRRGIVSGAYCQHLRGADLWNPDLSHALC